LNKIDKLEAILLGVQTAVYIVRMIIDQANAAAESNGWFFSKTNRFESRIGMLYNQDWNFNHMQC